MGSVFDASCILLAGGRSRRMGKDKGLLPLSPPTADGENCAGEERMSFAGHLLATLAPLCRETLLVVDREQDIGPLMGLYSGLSAMQSARALVVAIDMPYVQPELAAFLLSQPHTDEHTSEETLLIPVVAGMPQVLLAVYPRSILPLIEARLHEGRRDPRSLLAMAPVRYIEEAQLRQVDPQLRSFINMNTPEDLTHL